MIQIINKPFDKSIEGLRHYVTPDWFQDAKLGIFIHWGIYSVPAYGDEWYGHWMYKPNSKSWAGDDIYSYNKEHHPGKGYKDFIPLFKGEQFDAQEWIELFSKAGAKYIVPVAMHHDSFALYDSELTSWKSTLLGPKQDIIQALSVEARRAGLNFGLSNHFAENWWFFPYHDELDTSDPAYAALYNKENVLDEAHIERWYELSLEQIHKFEPDLLYYDFEIAKPEFKSRLRDIAAYYYNKQAEWNKGVVLNYKYGAFEDGEAVLDVERGQLSDIRPLPWQACTSISNKSWGYIDNDSFKSAEEVITTLIDITSKNGCLLLNVGPRADGTIPEEQQEVLLQLGKWLERYGEAIYDTRPWIVYGEGPTTVGGDALTEGKNATYTSEDYRFTASKDSNAVYVISLTAPARDKLIIKSLQSSNLDPSSVREISLIGEGPVEWSQDDVALRIQLPADHTLSSPFAMRIAYYA